MRSGGDGGCSPPGGVGSSGGLGAAAEKEWEPRKRGRDPLWALIATGQGPYPSLVPQGT